jgi:hypothetical protein
MGAAVFGAQHRSLCTACPDDAVAHGMDSPQAGGGSTLLELPRAAVLRSLRKGTYDRQQP